MRTPPQGPSETPPGLFFSAGPGAPWGVLPRGRPDPVSPPWGLAGCLVVPPPRAPQGAGTHPCTSPPSPAPTRVPLGAGCPPVPCLGAHPCPPGVLGEHLLPPPKVRSWTPAGGVCVSTPQWHPTAGMAPSCSPCPVSVGFRCPPRTHLVPSTRWVVRVSPPSRKQPLCYQPRDGVGCSVLPRDKGQRPAPRGRLTRRLPPICAGVVLLILYPKWPG